MKHAQYYSAPIAAPCVFTAARMHHDPPKPNHFESVHAAPWRHSRSPAGHTLRIGAPSSEKERAGRLVVTQPNRSAPSVNMRRQNMRYGAGSPRRSSPSARTRSRSRFAPLAAPPHTPHGFPPTPFAVAP
jgi:hypothetical protein